MNKKTLALCSAKFPAEGIKELEKRYKVYLLPEDKKLSSPVSHHPDMILTVIGNKLICHKDYFEKNKELLLEICSEGNLVPVTSETARGKKYPYDIGFNVLVTKKYLFANLKYTAPEVLEAAKAAGLEAVNVKQGYAACSTLLLLNTVVTADPSIYEAAKERMEALQIESGKIILEPYDTGFIGGATAYRDGTLYTFGELQGKFFELEEFLRENNIGICPLFKGQLSDFGGIKFI